MTAGRLRSPEELATSATLARLSPDDADHLAHLLREQAERRRRRVTVDDARAAYDEAELGPSADRSQNADILRIRAAAKALARSGWHPDQFAESLAVVGLERWPDGRIVAYAIAAGVRDARGLRR